MGKFGHEDLAIGAWNFSQRHYILLPSGQRMDILTNENITASRLKTIYLSSEEDNNIKIPLPAYTFHIQDWKL